MLNDRQLRKLTIGRHRDHRGLYFVVTKSGKAKWVYRYRMDGRSHDLGLGSYPQVSLKEARLKRDTHEGERLQGYNPIVLKRARREETLNARQRTFSVAFDAAYQIKAEELTNEKYRKQWHDLVARYALPTLGDMPIAEIHVHDLEKVLRPIWLTKSESARKLAHNLSYIFNWATAKGWRTGDNPAAIKGPLGILLQRQPNRVVPHPALPYVQLPGFMAKLCQHESASSRMLQYLILTASRTSEVLRMQRCEYDPKQAIWNIPAERMKARKRDRVPLSPQAMEIIQTQLASHNHTFIFPGQDPQKPLSNMAMLKLMKVQFSRTRATPHGFRSTFRDWAGEQALFDPQAIEFCLAHSLPHIETHVSFRLKRKRIIFNTISGGRC